LAADFQRVALDSAWSSWNRDGVMDQRRNDHYPDNGKDEDSIGDLFQTMHSADAAANAASSKTAGRKSETAVRLRLENHPPAVSAPPSVITTRIKNVDAEVLLQMRAWVAEPVRFSFHEDPLVD
jgi:hypothetical protein